MSKEESQLFTQLDKWQRLTKLPEWKIFVNLLKEHTAFCQREVNKCVESKDLIGAYGNLMKMKDIPKILGLVKKEQERLGKGKEN